MTIEIYIGSSDDITNRLAGATDTTTTTVQSVSNAYTFEIADATSFSVGDSITVRQQRRVIESLDGTTVTVSEGFVTAPQVGDTMAHYEARHTQYRSKDDPFSFSNDVETGGRTGDFVSQDLVLTDWDKTMAVPSPGCRITIFESVDSDVPLFAGVIATVESALYAVNRDEELVWRYLVEARGYQWEADSNGIEEEPRINFNSGAFLKYLMEKYTDLEEGEIDVTNSPKIDYTRLHNYRRFSEVGNELAALWPGSEFKIVNDHETGKVYFRQAVSSYAPIVLSDAYIRSRGVNRVTITQDHTKTFNLVRLPFYQLQPVEPDFFTQADTGGDDAYLKTSVPLSGQPASIEQAVLAFDDFSDGSLNPDFTDDDIDNPAPPDGFLQEDGYLVEGPINDVQGLHFLDTSAESPAIVYGDIGRASDPGEAQPFDGTERQTVFAKEIVVNTLGDAIMAGVIDQTTYQATVQSGATTTSIPLDDASNFAVGDRITVNSEKTYITNISTNTLTVSPALTGAPDSGDTVDLHRLAKSRVKWGVEFTAAGDLKYIRNGASNAFATPRTYSTETYSLRMYMRSHETTISGGISTTGCTLSDATHFETDDVVEIYTLGSMENPEERVITRGSGNTITYEATDNTPAAGYRIKTKPKIHLEIKGGAFGDINGRDWTQIHEDTNTWLTAANQTTIEDYGILIGLHKSFIGTMSLFKVYNPPGVTAQIGSQYLHLGTQEVDSAELDVDAIILKRQGHYQLHFFPDTKNLWASTQTLELRYDERFRHDFEEPDLDSMRRLAKQRGHVLTGAETETELARLGGRTLETVELLPNPLTLDEAVAQSKSILAAVSGEAITVVINTDTVLDGLCKPGQTLTSTKDGIENLRIERVVINEVPGAITPDGRAVFTQQITCGSVDRLADILLKRRIQNGSRLVIDDGLSDDSFTRLKKLGFSDTVQTAEAWAFEQCSTPSTTIHDQTNYAKLVCLRMPT